MVDTIKDGTGGGKSLRIDSENRAQTNAIVVPHASFHAAVKETTYYTNFKHTTVAGSTEEIVGYLTYNGTDQLLIGKVLVSSDSTAKAIIRFYRNPSGLSGGATVISVNSNFTSGNSLNEATADTNLGTSPITASDNGSAFFDFDCGYQSGAPMEIGLEDTPVLLRGNTIMVTVETDNSGETLKTNFIVFEDIALN